mmetsp:Transcript_63997/g.169435  ORF Transcript_63997/g.169435 Transcript_63997/m.169435 type:complete len:175 (-) Transcript_63997:305-829(-)
MQAVAAEEETLERCPQSAQHKVPRSSRLEDDIVFCGDEPEKGIKPEGVKPEFIADDERARHPGAGQLAHAIVTVDDSSSDEDGVVFKGAKLERRGSESPSRSASRRRPLSPSGSESSGQRRRRSPSRKKHKKHKKRKSIFAMLPQQDHRAMVKARTQRTAGARAAVKVMKGLIG